MVVIGGCLQKDRDDDDGLADEFSIGPTGGWVNPAESEASIYIREGSLSDEVPITIKKTSDLPDEEGIVKDLGFEFGPDGTRFVIPAYLYINYSGVELPDGVEDYMLRVYKVEGNEFILVSDCKVNTKASVVESKIDTFSKYVVMGKRAGFITSWDKDSIAADGLDTVTVYCTYKMLKKGDIKEPTGDPIKNTVLKINVYSLSLDGKKMMESPPSSLTTNEYGYVKFTNFANPGPPRYGYVKFSLSDVLSVTVMVKLGFEWPYSNHFDGSLGSEWTATKNSGQIKTVDIATSANGVERFLGPFTTDQVVLTLTDIPVHYKIWIEYDFVAIGPWEGGFTDQVWVTVKDDPAHAQYVYARAHITLQSDHFTGGIKPEDRINTLGYTTTPIYFKNIYNEDDSLEMGDKMTDLEAREIYHQNSTIKIAFNVDERGFGEDWDAGQSWGLDNVYVRLVGAKSS